ncbi:MAG: hypothetical protein AB7D29_02855 [Campylobacterales bacterium]
MADINKIVDDKLVPFVFIVSRNPVLFHDLLDANRQIKDNMTPNGAALGYKIHTKNMFAAFLFLVHIFFIFPAVGILHEAFVKMDCHLSIISAVVFTGLFFVSYSIFKEYLIERISLKRIREAWSLHFPLFDYETYGSKVADIYNEAIKKKVPRGELEFFVMSKLSQ